MFEVHSCIAGTGSFWIKIQHIPFTGDSTT